MGGWTVGYSQSAEELNSGHQRQIHLVAGRRIWTWDLRITSPAPYHWAMLTSLKYCEQLSVTLLIFNITTSNVQISIIPKVVATYHRSNPHIDSTPHPDLLLEAQPFKDWKNVFKMSCVYGLLTKCEVKMAGYFFLRVYGPRWSRGP